MGEHLHIPFIKMLYEYKGKREVFDCDFPSDFLNKFENENPDDYSIGYLFIIGQQVTARNLEEAIKICKG